MASLEIHNSPLGQKNAKHLLRRACFRYTKSQINDLANLTPSQALDILTQNSPPSINLPYDPLPNGNPDGFWTESSNSSASFTGQQRKSSIVSGWWWYNAIHNNTLQYKLSHFLSTRFTIEKNNGAGTATEFYDHIRLCMFYAYGNYKSFATKMTLDNSMLNYLNNTTNIKNSPNENYAREFFELFTIGKGEQFSSGNYTNYTENDIIEAAKVLTGFKRNPNRNILDTETSLPKGFNQFSQHNTTTKNFSSAFNNLQISAATNALGMDIELKQFVDMIFNQQNTAKHFCRKLYIYFVRSNITSEVEQDIISPLAQEFYNNNYEILPTIRRLMQSKHFYDLDDTNSDDETIGAIIKSPLQLISETCTYLSCSIPNPNLNPLEFYVVFWHQFVHNTFLTSANMIIFDPETVAGHPAYYQAPEFDKTWISSSTLIARYRMGESLLDGRNRIGNNANIFAKIDIALVIKNFNIISNPSDANILCQELCDALFAQSPNSDRINYFKNSFLLQGLEDGYWNSAWFDYLTTNNNIVVEPRLKLLVNKLISAPESQIF